MGGGKGVYNYFFVCKVHQLHFLLGQISNMFLLILKNKASDLKFFS